MQQAAHNPSFVSQIEDPDFVRLYEYWNRLRGERFAPPRSDLDPMDIKAVLGDVLLIDVQQEPLRFLFRLHGTNLAERAGYDMTGRYVDELPHDENRHWLVARYMSLLTNREPEYGQHDRIVGDRRWRYEVLWLPLSNDGADVDQLLGALRYRDTLETSRPIEATASQRITVVGDNS